MCFLHADHLRDKNIRAARYSGPAVCFLFWDVDSKCRPSDPKSPHPPFFTLSIRCVIAISINGGVFYVYIILLHSKMERLSYKSVFMNRMWTGLVAYKYNSNIQKYSTIIKKRSTYNGHFLLQVIHVLGCPLLLGGSVIFVLCGGNAVTVWTSILQTHTHVLYMPLD